MAIGFADAPEDAMRRALNIRPSRRPVTPMQLSASSRQASGARRDRGETFQLVFRRGDVEARLQYRFAGTLWEIMGRIDPAAGWSVETESGELPVSEDGRFIFMADTLADTRLRLVSASDTLHIPPADVDDGESQGAD
ncbi:MAG: hypothetical protein ACR2HJ_10755 [Fimbriimonadales bacterium]